MYTNNTDKKYRNLFFATFVCMVGLYLWVMASIPIVALTSAGYDDAWFVKMAARILAGQWLGPYNRLTLIKGPFFSLWLAINWIIGLPLLVSQAILYAGSGVLLLAALWNQIKKRWAMMIIFGYYLFNPMVYSLSNLRVTREGLYIPLTVMLLSIFAWNLRVIHQKTLIRLVWASILGLVGGIYWITREEGAWILPAYTIGCLGLFFIQWKKHANHTRIGSLIKQEIKYPATSIFCAWLVIECFALMNLAHYGVTDIVEFKQHEFVSAYGALSRVNEASWKRYVPLPKAMWPIIAQVSPKFQEIVPHLEDQKWAITASCAAHVISPCDDEIRAGWFLWALREAVQRAGYYHSANSAKEYYTTLASEINEACAKGKLQCLPSRITMAPPFRKEYLQDTWHAILRAIRYVSLLDGLDITPGMSQGSVQYYLSFFSDITHSLVFPTAIKATFLTTLTMSDSKPISVTVSKSKFHPFSGEVNLYNFVQKQKDQWSVDIEISTNCLDHDCKVEFRSLDHLIGTVSISELNMGTKISMKRGELQIHKTFLSQSGTYLPSLARTNMVLKILKWVGKVYQIIFPLFFIISFLIFIFQIAKCLCQRSVTPLFLLNCVLLTLIGTRVLLLTYLDATSMVPSINILYFSPLYPLILLFSGFVLVSPGLKYTRGKRQ